MQLSRTRLSLGATALLGLSIIGTDAHAQFGNEWAAFENQTASRLGIPSTSVSNGSSEVDFAYGDLDQDGFIDLVVVRKQPFTTGGKRANLLLMNEDGVLQDRTANYASASDVPGDQGFLTPTNDRDVVVTDFDGDGWLDIVTATTLSGSDPKALSHPRAYHNQQNSGGNWVGFVNQDGRIPQFMNGSTPVAPGFCAVAAGDVTGDDRVDLYFSDYSGSVGMPDIDDRLLINDGFGFFTDESSLRMTSQMLDSGFGTSAAIVDMNGDGANDVLKDWAANARAIYANPTQPGFFNLYTSPYGGSAYHIGAGDLNNDGRIDLLVSDDGLDRYIYNLGVDVFGAADWGPSKTFQFLSGGDDGFGSDNYVVDIDGDGWNDAIIADVDVDIGGCSRRIHLYHNPGGLVGSQITLVEEREQSNGGWLGVKGLQQSDLTGGHDVAVFDINNDGSNDLVLGRCAETTVWINEATCQEDLGFGGPGPAHLSVCGGDLSSGTTATMRLEATVPNQTALLFLGLAATPTFVNELGGTLVPIPVLSLLALPTGPKGSISIPGVPGGSGPLDIVAQFVIPDATQTKGYQVSNAVKIAIKP